MKVTIGEPTVTLALTYDEADELERTLFKVREANGRKLYLCKESTKVVGDAQKALFDGLEQYDDMKGEEDDG